MAMCYVANGVTQRLIDWFSTPPLAIFQPYRVDATQSETCHSIFR
jgi:hypothetical protein